MAKRYTILYEDNDLMVVDKPSGMLVIPTPKGETDTLTDLLNNELGSRGLDRCAHPCHRLDRETSGLIIYAKGKQNQQLMMEEFRKRAVKKVYIAFVHGIVKKNSDTLEGRIYNKNKKRPEEAITRYKVTARHKDFSVLEVEPVTGRTNQIRIQLKKLGHPLVGESVYVFRKDYDLKFKRVALHASYVAFTHPVTKEKMSFVSPMPEDMQSFLRLNMAGD
jgi:23S rRNA pseudouridine1911/1915/1917 synthase